MAQEIWSQQVMITVQQAGPQKISYTAVLSVDKTSGNAPLTVNFTMDIYFDREVAFGITNAYLDINGTRITASPVTIAPVPSTVAYSKQWRLTTSYTFNNPGTYVVRMGCGVLRIVDAQGNQYVVGYTEIWSNPVTVKGLEAGDWFAGFITGMLAVPVLSIGVQKLKEWYAKRGGLRLRR